MRQQPVIFGVVLWGAVAVSGCSPPYSNPDAGEPVAAGDVRLSWEEINPRHAEADAKASLSRGDVHLLGVRGYATEVPGTTIDAATEFLVIDDTGDVVRDGAHSRFNDRAKTYALAYNRTILAAPVDP